MRVRPLESYKLLGTEIELDKNKVYDAVPATNQPDWETKGLIFVDDDYHFGFLLRQGEYTIESEA
jgi:hypothetical protein